MAGDVLGGAVVEQGRRVDEARRVGMGTSRVEGAADRKSVV